MQLLAVPGLISDGHAGLRRGGRSVRARRGATGMHGNMAVATDPPTRPRTWAAQSSPIAKEGSANGHHTHAYKVQGWGNKNGKTPRVQPARHRRSHTPSPVLQTAHSQPRNTQAVLGVRTVRGASRSSTKI